IQVNPRSYKVEVITYCLKLAIILGTEGEGLADRTIEQCDDTIRIPMSHGVDSLNVAAASAVAFWELSKQ
ncbi:MAG: TrmH family RNA methyltransferase, partial [Clostridium sp.]